jgi:hypothetical protein
VQASKPANVGARAAQAAQVGVQPVDNLLMHRRQGPVLPNKSNT